MVDKINYQTKAFYSHNRSESDLASYQSMQIGNTCTFHGISTALRILIDFEVDPLKLSEEIDHLWWRLKPMRTFPGWAVTPQQQVQIIRHVAKIYTLPITAKFLHADPSILLEQLKMADTIALVTLIWGINRAPAIYYGNNPKNTNASKSPGAHTMLLAAYDPAHYLSNGLSTPWGFVNPWVTNGKRLFWMEDQPFQKAWNFFLPFVGHNPLVTMQSFL